MVDVASIIDSAGRIVQRGDLTGKLGAVRQGKVELTAGAYVTLNDGTVAGPMEQRNSNGDVYKWCGPRHALPQEDDVLTEAVLLGLVWLDSQGNAHSDSSPLDAASIYPGIVWW